MGPILIPDKSALQSLSKRECYVLARYYYANIPPVLVIEILADLKKVTDVSEGQREVAVLAGKIPIIDSKFNIPCRALLVGSLLGDAIPMTGQMVIPTGKRMMDENGQEFVFFDEPPEAEALRRWREGRFEDAERALAERYRQMTRTVDLEESGKRLREAFGNLPQCRNLEELNRLVEALLTDRRNEPRLLGWLIREAGLNTKLEAIVRQRWNTSSAAGLELFAPYGRFVTKVLMTFYIGLSQRLIGTRATNRIDLEYMLYLPFCYAFASRDAFHREVAPLFLRADQSLVDGDLLKADLTQLADWWEGLPDDEKGNFQRKHGGYPPDRADSLTNQLWTKHMRPRADLEAEAELMNLMSDEDRRRDHERIKPMLDAIAKQPKGQ